MNLGERVRFIRKELDMSQEEFGNCLGVSRDVIKNLENNRIKNISDALLRLICKTHRVSYFWLTEGAGDPYIGIPEVIIEEAVEEYKLDDIDKKIIKEYVKLDPQIRNAFKVYLKSIFTEISD